MQSLPSVSAPAAKPHQTRSDRWLASLTVALILTFLRQQPCNAQSSRVAWTTSTVQGSPEPPAPIVAERVVPEVRFKDPLDLASTPSLPQLFVLEQAGRVLAVNLSDPGAQPTLALDLKSVEPHLGSAYGLTFHPNFASNRLVYACYTLDREDPEGTRVAQFRMAQFNPPALDANSQRILLTFPSGGHNGGCLQFGADGMLYISTGDRASPSPPDPLNTGQDISDLLSSILRIDVNAAEGTRPYRIPTDNPFLRFPGARPEVWAYGLRNPWRMSFEPGTSVLWVGDVGWELWELVFRIDHGGMNCGWSVMEGSQQVRLDQKQGPTPIEKPIVAHSHEEAASITGGYFYRGKRVPEFRGAYLYGDWETGRMWALRHDQGRVTEKREIASTGLKIVAFGESADQELYLLDYVGGGLYALSPNPAVQSRAPFPTRLSETGLFTSTVNDTPAPGVYEFNVASPLWTDGAEARRWIGLPSDKPIRFTSIYWQAPRDLVPTNTVLARTVTLLTDRSKPSTRRKVETQLLHFNGLHWNAYTYRWNQEQTDAVLVPASGAQQSISIRSDRLPEGEETLTWRHHSRSECLRCHNPWNGTLLGFNPAQLSHAKPPTESSSNFPNEAVRLSTLGLLQMPATIASAAVDPHDTTQPLSLRARSYLHAQCGHCHRENAGGAVLVKLNLEPPLGELSLVNARPVQGYLGLTNTSLLSPGDPLGSLILYRFAKLGTSHMPYLGSGLVDEQGLAMLARWIAEMPSSNAPTRSIDWLVRARQALPPRDPAGTESRLNVSGFTQNPEAALALRLALADTTRPIALDPKSVERAQKTEDALVRDLLAPILPQRARRQVIGLEPNIAGLLSRPGNLERGRALFFSSNGLQCSACHTAQGNGKPVGPDLSQIAKKYTKLELLKQILEPSLVIDPTFATWTAELRNGESLTGCLTEQAAEHVTLKDATGATHRLPRQNLETLIKSGRSLMPEGLLSQSTVQEVADLLEFLTSLRSE